MLLSGTTVGRNPRRLDAANIARLGALAFQGARTIARLFEARASPGTAGGGELASAINAALDGLSRERGIDL